MNSLKFNAGAELVITTELRLALRPHDALVELFVSGHSWSIAFIHYWARMEHINASEAAKAVLVLECGRTFRLLVAGFSCYPTQQLPLERLRKVGHRP